MKATVIEALRDELQALAAQHEGRLTPDLVVQAAQRNPQSALYAQFTWDVKKAAREHWIEQARALIRRVRVEIQVEEKSYLIPAYVRDGSVEHGEQGYVAVEVLREDAARAGAALLYEFTMAEAHMQRAKNLAAVLQVQQAAEVAISSIKRARSLSQEATL